MANLDFNVMQNIQKELQEKYRAKWGGLSCEKGIEKLLWLYGELGEVGDIIKKNGNESIMKDEETRNHFIEEMCDVLMYFNDVLICFDITPDELEEVYLKKHQKNMRRW